MLKVMQGGGSKSQGSSAWKGRLYPSPRPLEMEAGKQEKMEEKQVRSEKSSSQKKPFLSFSPTSLYCSGHPLPGLLPSPAQGLCGHLSHRAGGGRWLNPVASCGEQCDASSKHET